MVNNISLDQAFIAERSEVENAGKLNKKKNYLVRLKRSTFFVENIFESYLTVVLKIILISHFLTRLTTSHDTSKRKNEPKAEGKTKKENKNKLKEKKRAREKRNC